MWDTEFVESFLKPELAAKVCLLHSRYRENTLARHLLRDKVVECVRLAWQQPGLFTVVDMHSQASNLRDLDEILLKAVFKGQSSDIDKSGSRVWEDVCSTLVKAFQRDGIYCARYFNFCGFSLSNPIMELHVR